ncbi:2Fe-2S iron-sulfur cluster binding domain-containing protein [Sphingomonas histidinilytica]|nr:2Fe-2S iron-sulfur cluster binding domain-containing protein [Rhizorhabdus histidinilytica]
MISIQVHGRDGAVRTISANASGSLLEALREHGFDEVLAICGGCCSCATCHVYVEQGPIGQNHFDGTDEDDLLDSSNNRQHNSRLACQIPLDSVNDFLSIRIAPEE